MLSTRTRSGVAGGSAAPAASSSAAATTQTKNPFAASSSLLQANLLVALAAPLPSRGRLASPFKAARARAQVITAASSVAATPSSSSSSVRAPRLGSLRDKLAAISRGDADSLPAYSFAPVIKPGIAVADDAMLPVAAVSDDVIAGGKENADGNALHVASDAPAFLAEDDAWAALNAPSDPTTPIKPLSRSRRTSKVLLSDRSNSSSSNRSCSAQKLLLAPVSDIDVVSTPRTAASSPPAKSSATSFTASAAALPRRSLVPRTPQPGAESAARRRKSAARKSVSLAPVELILAHVSPTHDGDAAVDEQFDGHVLDTSSHEQILAPSAAVPAGTSMTPSSFQRRKSRSRRSSVTMARVSTDDVFATDDSPVDFDGDAAAQENDEQEQEQQDNLLSFMSSRRSDRRSLHHNQLQLLQQLVRDNNNKTQAAAAVAASAATAMHDDHDNDVNEDAAAAVVATTAAVSAESETMSGTSTLPEEATVPVMEADGAEAADHLSEEKEEAIANAVPMEELSSIGAAATAIHVDTPAEAIVEPETVMQALVAAPSSSEPLAAAPAVAVVVPDGDVIEAQGQSGDGNEGTTAAAAQTNNIINATPVIAAASIVTPALRMSTRKSVAVAMAAASASAAVVATDGAAEAEPEHIVVASALPLPCRSNITPARKSARRSTAPRSSRRDVLLSAAAAAVVDDVAVQTSESHLAAVVPTVEAAAVATMIKALEDGANRERRASTTIAATFPAAPAVDCEEANEQKMEVEEVQQQASIASAAIPAAPRASPKSAKKNKSRKSSMPTRKSSRISLAPAVAPVAAAAVVALEEPLAEAQQQVLPSEERIAAESAAEVAAEPPIAVEEETPNRSAAVAPASPAATPAVTAPALSATPKSARKSMLDAASLSIVAAEAMFMSARKLPQQPQVPQQEAPRQGSPAPAATNTSAVVEVALLQVSQEQAVDPTALVSEELMSSGNANAPVDEDDEDNADSALTLVFHGITLPSPPPPEAALQLALSIALPEEDPKALRTAPSTPTTVPAPVLRTPTKHQHHISPRSGSRRRSLQQRYEGDVEEQDAESEPSITATANSASDTSVEPSVSASPADPEQPAAVVEVAEEQEAVAGDPVAFDFEQQQQQQQEDAAGEEAIEMLRRNTPALLQQTPQKKTYLCAPSSSSATPLLRSAPRARRHSIAVASDVASLGDLAQMQQGHDCDGAVAAEAVAAVTAVVSPLPGSKSNLSARKSGGSAIAAPVSTKSSNSSVEKEVASPQLVAPQPRRSKKSLLRALMNSSVAQEESDAILAQLFTLPSSSPSTSLLPSSTLSDPSSDCMVALSASPMSRATPQQSPLKRTSAAAPPSPTLLSPPVAVSIVAVTDVDSPLASLPALPKGDNCRTPTRTPVNNNSSAHSSNKKPTSRRDSLAAALSVHGSALTALEAEMLTASTTEMPGPLASVAVLPPRPTTPTPVARAAAVVAVVSPSKATSRTTPERQLRKSVQPMSLRQSPAKVLTTLPVAAAAAAVDEVDEVEEPEAEEVDVDAEHVTAVAFDLFQATSVAAARSSAVPVDRAATPSSSLSSSVTGTIVETNTPQRLARRPTDSVQQHVQEAIGVMLCMLVLAAICHLHQQLFAL